VPVRDGDAPALLGSELVRDVVAHDEERLLNPCHCVLRSGPQAVSFTDCTDSIANLEAAHGSNRPPASQTSIDARTEAS